MSDGELAGTPALVSSQAEANDARALALAPITQPPETGFYLRYTPDGLRLYHVGAAARDAGLRLDFSDGHIQRRASAGYKTPLARALGLRRRPRQRVLDTTCGLGRDSATLAALGCHVHALERHTALHALLVDARRRAWQAPPPGFVNWHTLEHTDALDWLQRYHGRVFDTIYIDPMFTAARRKARPEKALAWLGELVGRDADAPRLLAAARRAAPRTIVVKQHKRSGALATPDRQIQGKAMRFDIYRFE